MPNIAYIVRIRIIIINVHCTHIFNIPMMKQIVCLMSYLKIKTQCCVYSCLPDGKPLHIIYQINNNQTVRVYLL